MGSEQSQHQPTAGQPPNIPGRQIRPNPNYPQRLQRGNTIATPQRSIQGNDEQGVNSPSDSRPVSPPMSICSDSDLPYISYTDKPIGGENLKLLLLNFFHQTPVPLSRIP